MMNFFLQDLAGGLLAFFLFSIITIAPGFAIGWGLDFFGFRRLRALAQMGLSLILSVSITPLMTYLVARAFSLEWALGVYAIGMIIFLALLFYARPRRRELSPNHGGNRSTTTLFIVGWVLLCLFLLSDVQMGEILYPNVLSFDYAKHIAVTDAITRTGIPPINPSFFPGEGLHLYYYYFWFLLCSLIDTLGGPWVQARTAVLAGTAWAGLALISVLSSYLCVFPSSLRMYRGSGILLAVGLLFVSGLDVLPVAIQSWLHQNPFLFPSIEWWNDQITAWPNAVLWVPHHMVSLVAVLTAFLLLRSLESSSSPAKAVTTVALAAAGLASAFGLSIWVGLTGGIFWTLWMTACWLKGWRREMGRALVIGVLASAVSIPFVMDLLRASLLTTSPVVFSVKSFYPVETLLQAVGAGTRRLYAFDLLFLPVNYFIELGFFAIAGVLYWRQRLHSQEPLTQTEWGLVVMAASGFLVATFLKSNIKSNDLGWRSVMFLQFPLLIWATDLVGGLIDRARHARAQRSDMNVWKPSLPVGRIGLAALSFSFVLGTLTVLSDLALMKLYPMRADLSWLDSRSLGHQSEGRRLYGIREAYSWMNQVLPQTAIVQHNPNAPNGFYDKIRVDVFHGLYGHRQVVVADDIYGPLYGIPFSTFDRIAKAITPVFSRTAIRATEIREACAKFRMATLVVKDTDPVWHHADAWVWRYPPIFSNTFVKVFDCATIGTEQARP